MKLYNYLFLILSCSIINFTILHASAQTKFDISASLALLQDKNPQCPQLPRIPKDRKRLGSKDSAFSDTRTKTLACSDSDSDLSDPDDKVSSKNFVKITNSLPFSTKAKNSSNANGQHNNFDKDNGPEESSIED